YRYQILLVICILIFFFLFFFNPPSTPEIYTLSLHDALPILRRSSRIPKEIDILLVGSDTEGKVFSEKTKTVLLSRHGAGIVSRYKLSAEQELILRRLDTNKETEVRLVGQIGEESDVYTYGVAFLDTTQDFWDIQFPVPSEAEKEMRVVSLQCGSCQARETIEQSDLESDVY